ncbi:GntR family transcriptional regulator [Pseudarthrobacter sp. SL88]|uniref:GntR family transcriptional regulator n=1 Tax=Pseudarthrobacter sp. SL88 TaxID=2994666 RepID=UPI0022737804|nr:GntR family transcriptional regulator [Pseudarthrobacter sp. SL88]MCY1676513.1 GntR family transcriptional regulator [Pseudarthrobacter sp. SL88]
MPELLRERQQLSDEAAAYIRDQITSGTWPPGKRVKPDDVALALGISATPAREALQALRSEGFLDLIPRKGFSVAPLTGKDIRDLFRVHALLAGELVARGTSIATDADIAELHAMQHEMLASWRRKDMQRLEEQNYAFHIFLYSLGRSPKVEWVLGLVARYSARGFYSDIEGWPEATAEEHEVILEAFSSRDSERARLAIESHVVHSGELLADHFDSRVQKPGT